METGSGIQRERRIRPTVKCRHKMGFDRARIASPTQQQLVEQTRRLMEQTIAFVPHPAFKRAGFEQQLERMRPASLDQNKTCPRARPGIAFVSGLVDAPLLDSEEENYLFLRLNFLKSRAERRRRKLDLRSLDLRLIDQIQADLDQAIIVRNRIVAGNSRLIVALAKKLAGSLDQMSDLIGEGMTPLIRSVELFDISLGNKFSTYATWAVRNQMLKWLNRYRTQRDFAFGESSPSLENFPDKRSIVESSESADPLRIAAVQRLLMSLSDRERTIVAARFGLDGQPAGQSLSDISQQVGLSKERVRQILLLSLLKLREFISYDEFESIC